jgi:hypothetical protein
VWALTTAASALIEARRRREEGEGGEGE